MPPGFWSSYWGAVVLGVALLAVVALVIGLVVLRSALGRGRKRGSHEAATT